MPSHDAIYRFGPFELRTRTRELYTSKPEVIRLLPHLPQPIGLSFAGIPSDFEIAPVVKQRVDGFRILPSFVGAGELAGRKTEAHWQASLVESHRI